MCISERFTFLGGILRSGDLRKALSPFVLCSLIIKGRTSLTDGCTWRSLGADIEKREFCTLMEL